MTPAEKLLVYLKDNPLKLVLYFVAIALIIVAAVFAKNALNNRLSFSTLPASRQAADAFLRASSICDVNTMKQYYIPFQSNQSLAAGFKNTCVKGSITIIYGKRLGASQKLQDHRLIKNVSYLYNYKKRNGESGTLTVYTVWSSDKKKWQVFSTSSAANTKTTTT